MSKETKSAEDDPFSGRERCEVGIEPVDVLLDDEHPDHREHEQGNTASPTPKRTELKKSSPRSNIGALVFGVSLALIGFFSSRHSLR
jgi:hypothetical protein